MASRIAEVRARFRSEVSAELTQVRADLEKSMLEIDTGKDRLDRNSVRAPVSGFVNPAGHLDDRRRRTSGRDSDGDHTG